MADVNGVDLRAPDIGVETGTVWDAERVFGSYEDGMIFEYDEWSARDMSRMLGRDGQARKVEQVLTLPLMRAPWKIKGKKGDKGEAERVTEWLTTAANAGGMSTPFSMVIGQALGAIAYRKAFFEKVFRVNDADEIVYDKIAWRPPATCELARDEKTGGFRGFRQYPPGYGQNPKRPLGDDMWLRIPAERAFVYIHGQWRHPLQGMSDMEIPLWCFQTKNKLRYLWYTYLQRQSLPLTVVYGKSQPEAQKRARDLASSKAGGTVGMERPGAEAQAGARLFDIVESSGKGADQFSAAISFLDTEMAGSVLAEFTGLASQAASGHGSLALSSDQSSFFLQSREAIAQEFSTAVTNWLIADLVRFNDGLDTAVPDFQLGPISPDDTVQALTLLQALASSPTGGLPHEFIDELAVKVAAYLNMDTDKVQAALEKAATQREQMATQLAATPQQAQSGAQVGKVAGATDAAYGMTKRAQAGQNPMPTAKKTIPVKKAVAKTAPRRPGK